MITSIEPQLNANGRYTVKETSALLGIDRHTLSRYVKAGYIHPIFKRKPI